MKQNLLSLLFFFSFSIAAFCAGFDIRTSSVIDQPDVEVLGSYNGSWYAIGFEKPGNLNKPPRFKIFKYASGFKTGKISVLFNSFGEKTYYLRSAIINGKISMFYAVCEMRMDEHTMLDSKEGHKELPVIKQQNFNLDSLTADGEAKTILDNKEDFFASSGIEIVESNDKSKTAVLLKPFYRQQKYKVIITDNKTGEIFSKTYEFKELKEYLQFLKLSVSNDGHAFIATKVRDDIYSISKTAKANETTFYLFSIGKENAKPLQYSFTSPISKEQFIGNIQLSVLNSGELLLAADFFADEKKQNFKGVSLMKFSSALDVIGKRDISPDANFISQVATYHAFKKGKEFSNLETQQIIPLDGKDFMLIAEYHDTIPNPDKTQPRISERGYLLSFRIDENLAVKAQHYFPKKHLSAKVDYAFSASAFCKGNDVYLFHNADWETDDEHNMELQCTRLPADGSEPVTQKVLNTSNDFFTCVTPLYIGSDGKVLFEEIKLVEFGDVSREVKLLEVGVK
ncbi:MAG: hypothetical protein NTY88_12385 [Bacteroidetes bacterium]|nr:hypothetical protein [Bacteroidota bacterium]